MVQMVEKYGKDCFAGDWIVLRRFTQLYISHFLNFGGGKMNREGKKCVLYPRVSTEMQVDGYSLEGQKNSLKRFADREEMEIVGIYEDAGKSGKSIEGRPAFKENAVGHKERIGD